MSEPSTIVTETIQERRSPYAFSGAPLTTDELNALFEAARWAPSCFNEQPWRFFVGQKGDTVYDTILETLMDANAAWARQAPVLVIAAASTQFARNGKANAHARYDLGQAVASMGLAAWSRGIAMHQMGGFSAEAAAKHFSLPDDIEAVTAIAIGRSAESETLDSEALKKEQKPRQRLALNETVFGSGLNAPATFLG